MAEYTDDFSTDPASRWTSRVTSFAWDSTDNELDISHAGSAVLEEYTANVPGSIDHESQVTSIVGGEYIMVASAARIDGTASDGYVTWINHDTNLIYIGRIEGGTAPYELASEAVTAATGDWFTVRLAVSGAAGANVDIDVWYTNHGASKPTDPGWIGTDGAPDFEYTDTDGTRLDATSHDACGIGGRSAISADYDTRHSFWKSRAISDRGGAASAPKRSLLLGIG
jgi:hypothetical protein